MVHFSQQGLAHLTRKLPGRRRLNIGNALKLVNTSPNANWQWAFPRKLRGWRSLLWSYLETFQRNYCVDLTSLVKPSFKLCCWQHSLLYNLEYIKAYCSTYKFQADLAYWSCMQIWLLMTFVVRHPRTNESKLRRRRSLWPVFIWSSWYTNK